MQKRGNSIVYSASDLMAFLECSHCTTLNRIDLDTPLARAARDEQLELIQDKGFAHEANYLKSLRDGGRRIVELPSVGNFNEKLAATRAALAGGADIIFQAALSRGAHIGYADFLRRVETPSTFGAWSYEVVDTKLAHQAKPKFMIQLAYYSDLLGFMQGVEPRNMHLVLGNRTERSFRVADYTHYYGRLRQRFDTFLSAQPATAPEKCEHCAVCDWRERCAAEWKATDHLNQVAGIMKIQIKRLRSNGLPTLAQLGGLPSGALYPKCGRIRWRDCVPRRRCNSRNARRAPTRLNYCRGKPPRGSIGCRHLTKATSSSIWKATRCMKTDSNIFSACTTSTKANGRFATSGPTVAIRKRRPLPRLWISSPRISDAILQRTFITTPITNPRH